MKASQLRRTLLSEAEIVIKHTAAVARGGEPLIPKALEDKVVALHVTKIWEAVIPIISKAEDIHEIEAKTTSDVIAALKEGKLTSQEAIQLMQLLAQKTEIEAVETLAEQVKNLSRKPTPTSGK